MNAEPCTFRNRKVAAPLKPAGLCAAPQLVAWAFRNRKVAAPLKLRTRWAADHAREAPSATERLRPH